VLGPEVAYGEYSSVPGLGPELSCLAFMYDVRRARPGGVWSIDHLLKDQDDVHLRMTMLGPEGCELALAKGRPPQGKKSYEMTWTILRRKGPAPLASRFLTVLEPYQGKRPIRSIEPVTLASSAAGAFGPIGVRITSDDFVDTILFQADETVDCTTGDGITSDGRFAFWRERDGKCLAAVLAGGTKLEKGDVRTTLPEAAYHGRIKSCDWPNRTLVIEPAPEDAPDLVGLPVQLSNESGSHASYLIEAAEMVAGACRITLPLDPRIGEGFVARCEEGAVRSAARLRFHNYWRYYAGKTIADEDGSASYRLREVTRPPDRATVPTEGLLAGPKALRSLGLQKCGRQRWQGRETQPQPARLSSTATHPIVLGTSVPYNCRHPLTPGETSTDGCFGSSIQ
jgi:hypothetical protein